MNNKQFSKNSRNIFFLKCHYQSLQMYILFIVYILSDIHNDRILVMFKIVSLLFFLKKKKRFGQFLLTILVRTLVITFIAENTTCVSK